MASSSPPRAPDGEAQKLYARAVAAHRQGDLAGAEAGYSQALALAPAHFEALHYLALIKAQQNRFSEAESLLRRAVAADSKSAEAHFHLAVALHSQGRMDEAIPQFDKAAHLDPANVEASYACGCVLQGLGRLEEAVQRYDRALAAGPSHIEATYNRALALQALGNLEPALAGFRFVATHMPDNSPAASHAFMIAAELCDWRDRAQFAEGLFAHVRARRPILPIALMIERDDPDIQEKAAKRFAIMELPPHGKAKPRHAKRDKIRVAYASWDFRNHATAYLTAELLERHDRNDFETYAIAWGGTDNSPMRRRLESAFTRFIDVSGRTDEDVAEIMAELEIDIAVDMKGYTRESKPGIFIHRPAPLAVNYLAYPGTLGAPYIDYLIADPTLIPESSCRFYSEKIAYLPECYQPNDSKRAIAEAASRGAEGLPEHAFVFASFNNSYKITPQIFDIWMRLIKATENSVLWLYVNNYGAEENLKRDAAARGVPADRLVFAGFVPDMAKHLSRLRLADLLLDSFPYGAHTTASDALWAGVPLVTLIGESFPSRVAASLLKTVGLPELIAETPELYEALALNLARDPALLANFKQRLAQNKNTSSLFDCARYTKHLEAAYRMMWERHLSGQKPETFSVRAS